MHLCRYGSDWEVRAPAKLNLWLEVLGRRDDGYHDIETLMVPINLYDSIFFAVDPSGRTRLGARMAVPERGAAVGLGAIPCGDDNLVFRAVRLLKERSGSALGAAIHLVKRVPVGSGMGGGSSDAAAALAVANVAWRLGWPFERLHALAAELGSDVPFFLRGGAAICRGRGEHVQAVDGLPRMPLVVVRPPVELATSEVYAACQAASAPRQVEPIVRALRQGALAHAGHLLFNRLQATSLQLTPWIGRLRDELSRLDCLGHQMTGSGSGYFGMCRSAQHARRVASRLRARNVGMVSTVTSLGSAAPGTA